MGERGRQWNLVEEKAPTYLFSGTYEHSLDDKGRLTIPSAFRKYFSDGAILRRGSDDSIEILPRAAWDLFVEKLGKISKTDHRGQRWVTRQLASAHALDLDKSGRVLLASDLRQSVKMESGPVIVTGSLDRLKVWLPEVWQQIQSESLEELEDYVHEKYHI